MLNALSSCLISQSARLADLERSHHEQARRLIAAERRATVAEDALLSLTAHVLRTQDQSSHHNASTVSADDALESIWRSGGEDGDDDAHNESEAAERSSSSRTPRRYSTYSVYASKYRGPSLHSPHLTAQAQPPRMPRGGARSPSIKLKPQTALSSPTVSMAVTLPSRHSPTTSLATSTTTTPATTPATTPRSILKVKHAQRFEHGEEQQLHGGKPCLAPASASPREVVARL